MNIALVIMSALLCTHFEGLASQKALLQKVALTESEFLTQAEKEKKEGHEAKRATNEVAVGKEVRDKVIFLKMYRMLLTYAHGEPAHRNETYSYGCAATGYIIEGPMKPMFENLYDQLQLAISKNKAVLQNSMLATDLVQLCRDEKEVPVRGKLPKPRIEKVLSFTSRSYRQQFYMYRIASMLVENDADFSGITDEFPPKIHADECLSCLALRHGMLDQREAQQKVEQSS